MNDGPEVIEQALVQLAPTWEGREVKFEEWTVADDREVRKAFEADRDLGVVTLLSKAMRYADTGELVFKSAAEIDALPKRYANRVTRLAALAIDAVGKYDDEGGARPPTSGQSGTSSTA